MTQQQIVLSWLKDAHAMEEGGVTTLDNHAKAAQNYPEVQSKLREHVEATRRHADMIEGCIERLGGQPSAVKEAVGTVIAKVQGVANLPAKDTVVKNALGDVAAENFEIACYRSLIAAAEQISDRETADVCGQILREEEEMAAWLDEQIPTITRQYLSEGTGKDDQGSVLDNAKEAVKGLGEQGKGLASKVTGGDAKDALITSGALLAGAGAALLITQALRGGSEKRGDDESVDTAEAYGVVGAESDYAAPSTLSDLQAEPMSEPLTSDLSGEGLGTGDALGQTEPDLLGMQGDQIVDMGGDAYAPTTADMPVTDTPTAALMTDTPVTDVPMTDMPTAEGSSDLLSDAELAMTGQDDVMSPDTELADGLQGGVTELTYTEVWLVPGPYSGVGPVGYDSAGDPVGQEVYSRLTQHGQVDASNIEIVIDNGEVLLEGTVDSEETKRLVEEAVEGISDVNSVQNLLRVQGDEGTSAS